MAESIEQNDGRARRCPRLGHEVKFSYCRAPGSDALCTKIGDCWWETFDVQAYLLANYGPEALEQLAAGPRPRVLSLLECIERAKAVRDAGTEAGEGEAATDAEFP